MYVAISVAEKQFLPVDLNVIVELSRFAAEYMNRIEMF